MKPSDIFMCKKCRRASPRSFVWRGEEVCPVCWAPVEAGAAEKAGRAIAKSLAERYAPAIRDAFKRATTRLADKDAQ